jgi:hypothetical protein
MSYRSKASASGSGALGRRVDRRRSGRARVACLKPRARPLQGAVYGGNARPEEICDLGRLPAKHLAEDQDSALLRRQVLERRAEREPDGLMGEDSVLGNPAARVQPVAQSLERRAQIECLRSCAQGACPTSSRSSASTFSSQS